MTMENSFTSFENLQKSIVEIAVEAWRFKRIYEKSLQKLDVIEQARYFSQFSWFGKKIYEALENAGLKLINVEGELFDVGMAVTPINLDEFEDSDELYIEQMIEPIIMNASQIVKTGTVVLGRKGK